MTIQDSKHGESSGAADGGGSEHRRLRRWVAAGLAVLVVVVVVFAMGQAGDGGRGPLGAIAKAAEATRSEAGGHALIQVRIISADKPRRLTESGSLDFENGGRARGTMAIRGLTDGRAMKVQVITDGTTAYSTSDQLDSLPEGRRWVKIDLSSASSSSSLPADGGATEGLKLLEQLDGAEEIGREDIRGVSTRRYRGTLPVTDRNVLGVELDISPPRIEVWIDGRNRVRRMTAVISGSVGGKAGSTTHMTTDFVDFRPVPKIELPKKDETLDVTGQIESELKSLDEKP